jgi:hypothetical protein
MSMDRVDRLRISPEDLDWDSILLEKVFSHKMMTFVHDCIVLVID